MLFQKSTGSGAEAWFPTTDAHYIYIQCNPDNNRFQTLPPQWEIIYKPLTSHQGSKTNGNTKAMDHCNFSYVFLTGNGNVKLSLHYGLKASLTGRFINAVNRAEELSYYKSAH
jgi:hypothetical protein